MKTSEKGFEKNFPEFKQLQVIDGQWTVDFQNKAIGPVETVNFETLKDWSQMEDEKIKYYSGTAIYQTTFELNELPENDGLFINLGDVSVMAKVKINGAEIGGTWMAPFRLKAGAESEKRHKPSRNRSGKSLAQSTHKRQISAR
jgi:hypothetical protein